MSSSSPVKATRCLLERQAPHRQLRKQSPPKEQHPQLPQPKPQPPRPNRRRRPLLRKPQPPRSLRRPQLHRQRKPLRPRPQNRRQKRPLRSPLYPPRRPPSRNLQTAAHHQHFTGAGGNACPCFDMLGTAKGTGPWYLPVATFARTWASEIKLPRHRETFFGRSPQGELRDEHLRENPDSRVPAST